MKQAGLLLTGLAVTAMASEFDALKALMDPLSDVTA